MENVFLFGTLCWAPLLLKVAGPTCPQPEMASLDNYAVSWAKGAAFPAIHQNDGSSASGLLLRDCAEDVLRRMDHYESGFGYTLHPVELQTKGGTVKAKVYLPPAGIEPGPAWNLGDWTATHGQLALEASHEVMDALDVMSPEQVARRYPMMKVRADSRIRARENPSPASSSNLASEQVTTVAHRRPYTEFFAFEEMDLLVPKFDGGQLPQMSRGCFVATEAAIVLPYDPVRDCVLLIEQFRVGPYMRGDKNPWTMEAVAGRVDPGETPEQAAKREAFEEAKLTLTDLHTAHVGYSSPGASTELFHIFVGIADLPDSSATLAGLDGEAEDIKGHVISFDDFHTGLINGDYPVTPVALAGFWLANNRDRLRDLT